MWRHGTYPRKADRSNTAKETLNPILIQRFYCPDCKTTCSALPECISSKRWYLWDVQHAVLLLVLTGRSLSSISKQVMPSRRTITRWVIRFKDQFLAHKNALCRLMSELGRTNGFTEFWKACLEKISLAEAMRLCHVLGEIVP